jgi:hypothetical protein
MFQVPKVARIGVQSPETSRHGEHHKWICLAEYGLISKLQLTLSTALSFSNTLSCLRVTAVDLLLGQNPQEFDHLLNQGLPELGSLHIRWGSPSRKISHLKYTVWKV